MTSVTILGDFGAQENKICHYFQFFLIYLQWNDETGCHDLHFLNAEFFHSPLSPSSRGSLVSLHFLQLEWSVQFSCSAVSASLRPHGLQHARPPYPSPTPGVYPNPCPLSRWCHPTISSSVVPISSCPQSFPASGSFQMSQLFTSGGQSSSAKLLHCRVTLRERKCVKLEFMGSYWVLVCQIWLCVPF